VTVSFSRRALLHGDSQSVSHFNNKIFIISRETAVFLSQTNHITSLAHSSALATVFTEHKPKTVYIFQETKQ